MHTRWLAVLCAVAACQAPQALSPQPERQRQAMFMTLPGGGFAGPAPQELFGHAVALADFNGDGFTDLAVGAPGASITFGGEGRAYVFFGPLTNTGPSPIAVTLSPASLQLNAAFGSSLAVGDFNNDGVDDLAVGAPGYSGDAGVMGVGNGAVFEFHGQMGAYISTSSRTLTLNVHGRLGAALAAFKSNASITSLWAGAPDLPDGGSVFLYNSSASGLTSSPFRLTGPNPGEQFGSALATPNLDLDGGPDVVVGAPEAGQGAGAIYLYVKSGSAWSATGSMNRLAGTGTEALGFALAGSRALDSLAIGAPRAFHTAPQDGRVAWAPNWAALSNQNLLTDSPFSVAGASAGAALLLADLDGDDVPELVAGAPGAAKVALYANGLRSLGEIAVPAGTMSGSAFGCSLAGNRDLNQDGVPDLAIGAELYVDALGETTGAVFLRLGARDGGTLPPADAGRGPTPCNTDAECVAGCETCLAASCVPVECLGFDTCVPGRGCVPPPPVPVFTIQGGGQPAPALVTVDPSLTRGAVAASEWDFGDLSPVLMGTAPMMQSHGYAVPGGYQISLTVTDPTGTPATLKQPVLVLDRLGRKPPSVLIAYAAAADANGSLMASFTGLVTPGDGVVVSVHWDFGDSEEQASGTDAVTRTFDKGTRRVHVWVDDSNGLWGTDAVTVSVSQPAQPAPPPRCHLVLLPYAGLVPLKVTHAAQLFDAAVSGSLMYEGGTATSMTDFTYADEGLHRVLLEAKTNDGTVCLDRADVRALAPPRFVSSLPASLGCRAELDFTPQVAGTGPFVFTLEATPEQGFDFDTVKGTVHWAPPAPGASANVKLVVDSPWGADVQQARVSAAECATLPPPKKNVSFDTVPCGCATGPEGLLALLGLARLLRRRR